MFVVVVVGYLYDVELVVWGDEFYGFGVDGDWVFVQYVFGEIFLVEMDSYKFWCLGVFVWVGKFCNVRE